MEAAVHERDLHVEEWEACEGPFIHGHAEALLYRGPEFSRHVTARHLGFEHVPRPYFPRLHGVVNLSELPRTPGLLFVGVGIRNRRGDRFPVGHLRLTDGDVDAVGPLEDIHLDVEVKLTHALDDRFPGFFIRFHPEGGILGDHLRQGHA